MLKIKRLPEALKMSADTIEELYKELKRSPPPETTKLIDELRELATNVLTSQEFLNAKIRL